MKRVIILLALFTVIALAGYGDPSTSSADQVDQGELPTSPEREAFALFNFLRGDRKFWRDTLVKRTIPNFNGLNSGSNRAPLHYDRRLSGACNFHVKDMAHSSPIGCVECCNDSPQCNDSSITVDKQMKNYGYDVTAGGAYGLANALGMGSATPYSFILDSICASETYGGGCSSDSSEYAGFRKIAYINSYKHVGIGYYYLNGSEFGQYWEFMFANNPQIPVGTNNKIASGSVVTLPINSNDTHTFYLASFTDGARETSVVVDGSKISLSKVGSGYSYLAATESELPAGGCTEYYFMFSDKNTVYRYPEGGNLEFGASCTSPTRWVADTASCAPCNGTCYHGGCVPLTSGASMLPVSFVLFVLVLLALAL